MTSFNVQLYIEGPQTLLLLFDLPAEGPLALDILGHSDDHNSI
jgi:hypothetical protein